MKTTTFINVLRNFGFDVRSDSDDDFYFELVSAENNEEFGFVSKVDCCDYMLYTDIEWVKRLTVIPQIVQNYSFTWPEERGEYNESELDEVNKF